MILGGGQLSADVKSICMLTLVVLATEGETFEKNVALNEVKRKRLLVIGESPPIASSEVLLGSGITRLSTAPWR